MQNDPSAAGGVPSGPHFKNIEPQTRDQRAETKNKDILEKKRILARHGQGGTYVDEPHKNPMIAAAGSPMYIDEYDRFNRDVAAMEQKKKQDNIRRKEVGGSGRSCFRVFYSTALSQHSMYKISLQALIVWKGSGNILACVPVLMFQRPHLSYRRCLLVYCETIRREHV